MEHRLYLIRINGTQIAFNCSHIGRLLIKIHGGKFNKFKKSGYYAYELTEIVKQCINVTEKERPYHRIN